MKIAFEIYKLKRHAFPIALLLIFIALTILGISGSSLGFLDQQTLSKTPGVIANQPRGIRSDEWLVQAQQLLIQKAAGYPENNKNIGNGQDMSLINDVPTKSFFTLFKPQNFFFFVLPFKQAFAAHWWFMALVLCLGFYVCLSRLLPKKKLVISLVSISLLFNPFTQWWYQSITLLTIGYALLTVYCFVCLFDIKKSKIWSIFYPIGLAYFSLCFIFNLYPPFQIAVGLASLTLLTGFLYHRYHVAQIKLSQDTGAWTQAIVSIIVAIAVSTIFIFSHLGVINALTHTEYPAKRNINSGQYDGVISDHAFERIFSAPLAGYLQNDARARYLSANQSEASVFIFINLILTPIVLFHILKKPRKLRTAAETYFITISFGVGLFALRFFTPLFNLPFKFILLNNVQNERAEIGLIVLCVIQLALLGSIKLKDLTRKQALFMGLLTTVVFGDSSLRTVKHYPGFISPIIAILLCLLLGLIVFMLLRQRLFKYGIAIFVILNLANSIFVNPLYARSEPKVLEDITTIIQKNYPDSKTWGVMDSIFFENAPLVAGKHAITGVNVYPQIKQWETLDPNHSELASYNRYAHVGLTIQQMPDQQNFISPQPDVLLVKFSCDNAKQFSDFGYILTPDLLDIQSFPCLRASKIITYPNITLYIYAYST